MRGVNTFVLIGGLKEQKARAERDFSGRGSYKHGGDGYGCVPNKGKKGEKGLTVGTGKTGKAGKDFPHFLK